MEQPQTLPINPPAPIAVRSGDWLDGWTWTCQKPMECGWYWVKSRSHPNPRIMRFKIHPVTTHNSRIQPVDGPLSTEGWEWFCGPIPKPSNASS